MDFSQAETHIEIKNLAADILGDHSESERLKKQEANGPYLDKEVWDKLIETGIHGASLPESVGGMGLDYSATAMVAEVIGQTLVSIPYIPCIISSALPLSSCDNNTATELLKEVAAGETLLTTAFIEAGNENPLAPSTTADNDGTLNGSKHCVPFAANSKAMLLSANNNDSLWVGLVMLEQDGVTLNEQTATAQEPQYSVTLNNAQGITLATGDEAEKLFKQSVAMTTTAYCAMAVGAAERMTKIAGEYTSQREQFGVAIATFQAVAHRLADSYIDNECLKIITQKAISDVNHGDVDNDSIAMAKVWCGDVLHRASHTAQHVHGGAGIDKDYHLWRYCLWAKQLELALGSSRVHLANLGERLAADYLAKSSVA